MRIAPSAPVRARFERAMATIAESRKSGLPNRVEMAVGGALALLVGRDAEMAREAAAVLDLIPGFKGQSREVVTPFAELVAGSIDVLEPVALEHVAKQMTLGPPERLVAAAAAWVRLDVERAKAIATMFREGNREAEERRWLAVAHAQLARRDRNPEMTALIPGKALGRAISAAPDAAPAELVGPVLLTLIRDARNPAELLAAVRPASARREHSVARALLAKLRETQLKIDEELEALLPSLFGADEEDWVEQEIDGENPFRDRREALGRALAKARSDRAAGPK
jgi:hypothetical protein